MTKSNIRALFREPPPTIEDIIAGKSSKSSEKMPSIPHKTNEGMAPSLESSKITQVDSSKESTLNKRKEPILDEDQTTPTIKKLKNAHTQVQHVKNDSTPEFNTDYKAVPHLASFNYPALKPIEAVQPVPSLTPQASANYFVENILAGLKSSATKRPYNPKVNTSEINVLPVTVSSPLIDTSCNNNMNTPTAMPVTVSSSVTERLYNPNMNTSPKPTALAPSLAPSLSSSETERIYNSNLNVTTVAASSLSASPLASPALPPSSLPTPSQSPPPPPPKITKQGKKKLARQKKAEMKKQKAKNAACKHFDAPKNVSEIDFETLLRQHEKLTAIQTQRPSLTNKRQQTKTTQAKLNPRDINHTPNEKKKIEKKPFEHKTKFVPTIVCKYFLKGTCRQDGNCTFKHEGEAPPPPTSRTVCQFFKTGSCTQGEDCKFSHDLQIEPCRFFHMQGTCEQGNACPYSHEPLNEERLDRLRKLTGPCRFYLFKGYCTSGDSCLFSHEEASEEERKKVESTITACRFFHITKNCKQGNDCFYLHEEASLEQIKKLNK